MDVETKAADGVSSEKEEAPVIVGAEALAVAWRRMVFSVNLTMIFVVLTAWGILAWINALTFGGEIRSDPFDPTPSFADLLLHPVPHRALQTMPYVPVGARGTLTLRPEHTDWINTPEFPIGTVVGGNIIQTTPAQSGALSPISPASASDAPARPSLQIAQTRQSQEPVGQQIQQIQEQPQIQEAPAQQQQQQIQKQLFPDSDFATRPSLTPQEIFVPVDRGGKVSIRVVGQATPPVLSGDYGGNRPRVLDASCIDGSTCWLVGDSGRVALTTDGGKSWVAGGPYGFQRDGSGATDYALLAALPPQSLDQLLAVAIDGLVVRYAMGADGRLILPEQEAVPALIFEIAMSLPDRPTPEEEVIWVAKPDGLMVRVTEQPLGVSASVALRSEGSTTVQAIGGDAARPVPQFLAWSEVSPGVVITQAGIESERDVSAVRADEASGQVWILAEGGGLTRVTLDNGPASDQTVPVRTEANLRNIRFASANGVTARQGWISSGWNDGNEEGERPVVLQTLDGGATWERLTYRQLPAPWVFLSGFLALVVGARATSQVRRYNALEAVFAQQERIIGADAASDSPIGWADEDVLGLRPIARALSRFMRNRDTIPPVTFGITGAWGTGKSSLMRLVADDLRYYGARPVLFNAWHHQTEDHLLAALLESIKTQGVPGWWTFSGLLFRANLLLRRSLSDLKTLAAVAFIAVLAFALASLLRDGVVAEILERLVALVLGLMQGETTGENVIGWLIGGLGGTGATLTLLYVLFRALRQLKVITVKPAALMAKLSSRAGINQFEAQLSFRHRFQVEFGQVCLATRTIGGPGMVIFIDDLDRCKPDKVLVVLEAVNFLVSAGPCFVVLGIDEEKVIQSVAHGFKDSILVPPDEADQRADGGLKPSGRQVFQFARNYLEKLINISVPIPETDVDKTGALLGAEQPEGQGQREEEPDKRPFSDVPRRVRMGLRGAGDWLGGVLPISLVLVLLVTTLAELLPPLEVLAPTAEEVVQEGARTSDGQSVLFDDDVETGPTQPQEFDLDAEPSATADPSQLSAVSWWWSAGGAVLLLLLLLILFLNRTIATDRAEVQDRPEFLTALKLWLPLIHARHPTPRSIKRFQNHTRFLAMLLRSESRREDWLDRIAGRLGYRTRHPDPPPAELDERKLVALQSLYDFDPALFEPDHFKSQNGSNVVELFSRAFGSTNAPVSESQRRALNDVLSKVSDKDIEAFMALRPTVTSATQRHGDETDEASDDSDPKPDSSRAAE